MEHEDVEATLLLMYNRTVAVAAAADTSTTEGEKTMALMFGGPVSPTPVCRT